ncbi:uncharacterized protein LOC122538427 isoform X2 [Frieseomelitta varia]|uniref:uncharacterized protein LOC122538427 isoform X2 n=1 Tax=Frieseomelitta varia TaxID=561572 RepID=UPI001CB6AA56|nr:uncharacterized protein LOC122538427 isoform X2 [Frieseomelitta varia]
MKIKQGSSNISTMSVPRNQNTMSHSSNNIEDVIGKIDNLRLAHNQSNEIRRLDVHRTKLKERGVTGCQTSKNTNTYDREHKHNKENNQDDLIERGPIKSQFCPLSRSQPYCTRAEQPRFLEEANEIFSIDYDKTAEQILRDKECSEKLNACLDQLQNLERTNYNYSDNDRDQSVSQVCGSRKDLPSTPSTIVDDILSDEFLLLENVICGAFQAAQPVMRENFDFSLVVSNSGSRESSRAHSPVFPNSIQSPGRTQQNSNHSPASSPQITVASTFRPTQIFSYSSSSPSSSSQSYSDTSSPNSSFSHRTTASSRIDGQFEQDFENFQLWRNDHETVSNTVLDDIGNNELWSNVIDELVNNLNKEKDKGEGTYSQDISRAENANIITFETNNLQQVRYRDSLSDNITIVTESLPWSSVSYSTVSRTNIPQKGIQRIDTNPTQTNSVNGPLLSSYSSKNDTTVERSTETSANDNIHHERDFSVLFHSFDDSSPTVNTISSSFHFDDYKIKNLSLSPENDFQIPETVSSFKACSQQHCDFSNSDRGTIPFWPSLNLPSVKASEKLKEKLDPKEVKKAMISLLKRPVEELAKQDKDGDTKLMCLVGNPNELVQKMAYLVPLVERMSTITGALTITNDRGFDALYLTALNCPEFPFVAGYLAAAMLQKGIDISQRLYHTRGDTLIHSIAAQGDSHKETLGELLALKTIQENQLFDLSKRNYDGRTALHVAIESHVPFTKGTTSLETVKLLLKYGADPTIKETKCGNNALHMAVSLDCDPILVKLLLDTWTSDLVNAVNYNHDTALHVATAKSTNVTLKRQKEVCWLLIQAGCHKNLLNQQGKTPLALASVDRKEAIREILHKRS